MKGHLSYLSDVVLKSSTVQFTFLAVSKWHPLLSQIIPVLIIRQEQNQAPEQMWEKGFTDNCAIIKMMLIRGILVAFSCCGYFFSYYLENFDHKAEARRLLITFTFPSVFFENCTSLVEFQCSITQSKIWRRTKLLARVEKIIIAVISEIFRFQSRA